MSGVIVTSSQVLYHREDPRLREQEWGNFQNPTEMEEIKKQRRQTGAFYYRFPTGERYIYPDINCAPLVGVPFMQWS